MRYRKEFWGKSKWGLSNGGLAYSFSIVHHCLQLSSFGVENSLQKKGPKGHKCAHLQTIVHELQRVALSTHLRDPIWTFPSSILTRAHLHRRNNRRSPAILIAERFRENFKKGNLKRGGVRCERFDRILWGSEVPFTRVLQNLFGAQKGVR